MSSEKRFDQIVAFVDEQGFVSVKELSKLLDVSEVTIRRDLQTLHDEKRLRKTFGGGVSLRASSPSESDVSTTQALLAPLEGNLTDRVDVLITTIMDPQADRAFIDRASNKNIPVIAESTEISGAKSLVAVDNYAAGKAMGEWAASFAQKRFREQANVLDLTFDLSNTEARSRGFIAGIQETLPSANIVLSINAQSDTDMAYQLTADALRVHPNINIIFAINDVTACGAIRACQNLDVNPNAMLVLTFGLEGDTLKNVLMEGSTLYCKAGLAMFPEIVAPVCIEAAIQAYNGKSLPQHLITPHMILTPETLTQFYARTASGWHPQEDAVQTLRVPLPINQPANRQDIQLPKRIGFVIPFVEHEWYRNLRALMQAYANSLGIEFEATAAAQIIKDDIALRQRAIARAAAELVHPGDVLLIDGSEFTSYLAEELTTREDITVITNSIAVFNILEPCSKITLISTGGSLRRASSALLGPMAEKALGELRADKLFLFVSGISLEFGLSHNNVGEVAVKRAMMQAAREVILLADHTRFAQESMIQVAPTTVVNKLITDTVLPAETRLELSKQGTEVVIAKT